MLCGTCKDSSILELADDDLSIKFVCGGGGGEKERERRKGDPREIKWRVVPKCSMFQSEWDQVRCSNGKRVIIFANSRVIEWLKAPKTGSDSIEPPTPREVRNRRRARFHDFQRLKKVVTNSRCFCVRNILC